MTDWLLFYLALQLTALAALPLTVRVFRALPDRGYALSKFLGLLLLSYAAWLLGMLGYFQHTRASLIALLVVIAVVIWAVWRPALFRDAPPRGVMVAFEVLLLVALLGGSLIRAYNADINGQEKFMDFAFVNAFYAADHLPAEDPWLAGYGVPYYHFGYLVVASVSELAGVAAPVGYNLALVLILALTILAAASLVFNAATLLVSHDSQSPDAPRLAAPPRLRVALPWALLAAALVGLIGNLEAVLEVIAAQGVGGPDFWRRIGIQGLQPAAQPQGWPPAGFNWFRTSRVIPNIQPDGINEFPYFSFLLGDLHPHYVALPFDLLVLGLAFALVLGGRRAFGWPGLGVTALALGSIIATNTWDVPTFWLAFAAASIWAAWREGELLKPRLNSLWQLALPFALGVALFLPYYVGYTSQRLGVALVSERTPIISMLILLGPFLAVVLVFGLWGLASGNTRSGVQWLQQRVGPPATAISILVVLAVLLVAALNGEWTLLLLGSLLALLAPLGPGLAARISSQVVLSTWFLAFFALLILVGTEIIFIYDSFGSRMNTVFKFHYHAWLLLGLASALALLVLARHTRPAGLGKGLAVVVAVGLLGSGAVYPVTATYVKSGAFRIPPTLDGARFLAESKPADYRAITWLRTRTSSRPVVLEAVGPDYQEFARVSTFSGLPTVLGWVGHELQWRGNGGELAARERDVDLLYRSGDEATVRRLLDQYRVDYVFVGSLERQKYGPAVDARFARLLEPAFQADTTTVYRVVRPLPLAQVAR